jgi:hypothetical protein
MTCKDCLSYEACMKWTDCWLDTDRACNCENFKNKADFVEVVRCKDCAMHEEGCPLDTHPYMTPNDGYCYKGKKER